VLPMLHPTSAMPPLHLRPLALTAYDPVVVGQGFT